MSHNRWLTSRKRPPVATRAMPTAAFSKMDLNRASFSRIDSMSRQVVKGVFPSFPTIKYLSPKCSDLPVDADGGAAILLINYCRANAIPRAGLIPYAIHAVAPEYRECLAGMFGSTTFRLKRLTPERRLNEGGLYTPATDQSLSSGAVVASIYLYSLRQFCVVSIDK